MKNNASKYISIIGPDGSGKSTVISAIEEKLISKGYNFHYHHWNIKWSGPVEKNNNVNTAPHAQKTRNTIGSCAQLLYLLLKSYFSWLRWVLPIKQKYIWILLDRGPLDILVDPMRYRNSAPKWVRRLWCKIQPTADISFVLTAPAEVIHKRKAEVELDVLKKIVLDYKNLCGHGIVHISVDQPVDKVVEAILAKLELD